MPKCINVTTKYYTGNEKSPMGLGYCSSGEDIGKKMKGKDNNLWIVKEGDGGKKRWIKFNDISSTATPDKETESEKIIPTKRNALYYDVASDIFTKYKKYDYEEYISKIEIYIEKYKNEFELGDILFVGLKDDSLSRNEWGFLIILDNGNYKLSTGLSSAGSLPLLDEEVIETLANKVSYKEFFEKYKENYFFTSSFLNDDPDMYDELKKEYETYNIW